MMPLLVIAGGGAGVGLGHLRRCLTLAAALKQAEVAVTFAVFGGKPAEDFVTDAGFDVIGVSDLSEAAAMARRDGAAIIDTYRATADFLTACKPAFTVVMDDLAEHSLPVDVVVNSAPGAAQLPYAQITDATLLLGAEYTLLRPEFAIPADRETRPEVNQVLITLGGGEQSALAADIARWCLELSPAAAIDVVIGPFGQPFEAFGDRVTLLRNPDMRKAMLRSDLAVSAGGQTLFELAATGLPGIAVETAPNQRHLLADFEAAGTIVQTRPERDAFRTAFALVASADARRQMSARGPALVDGHGAARTAETIVKLLRRARSAKR